MFDIRLEPDGDGWRAYYPPWENKGASMRGSSPEEALGNLQEVLETILDVIVEELDEGYAAGREEDAQLNREWEAATLESWPE